MTKIKSSLLHSLNMGVKYRSPLLILHGVIIDSPGVDKNMIADDLEVNFVHPWKLRVSELRQKSCLHHSLIMGVKTRRPLLILHWMIRDSVGVDKNMIPDDLEVNFVHPWKLKAS